MQVLLTGAFGNIGESTLKKLINKGHSVRCFDIKTSKNERKQRKFSKYGNFETLWGDITNLRDIKLAVKDVNAIIHLAGIIPPLSEKKPEIAYKVNVEGTRLIIEEAKKLENLSKFVVASSISVFGKRMKDPPPRKVSEPPQPTDNYTHQKVEVEEMVKKSGLSWLILRLSAAVPRKLPLKMDPIFFDIPLDQRIEFLYTGDAGTAFVNSISIKEDKKILLIGGGIECQMLQREFIKKILKAMGITMLPESAFRPVNNDTDWYYTDFLDTEESQKLLNYQKHTYDDYIKRLRRFIALRRFGLRMVGPLVKLSLLVMSPYYHFKKKSINNFNVNKKN